MRNVSSLVALVRQSFASADSTRQYRKALALASKLPKTAQLEVFDSLFAAAHRLNLGSAAGLPRVEVKPPIRVRGKTVEVERLA